VPWRFFGLLGSILSEWLDEKLLIYSSCFAWMLAWWRRAGLCVVGGAVGRHCGCELGKFRWAIRAMRRRPGLEVPDPVGADSAPLEVIQVELMVQCWVTMAPLEVLQGHALAVA